MLRSTELMFRRARKTAASPDDSAAGAAAAEWFALRDAGLSAEQEREFQHWLDSDPRHGPALARLDAAWSTFGRPARTGAADELFQELEIRATRRRRRRMSAAVATLVVLFAVGSFWRVPREKMLATTIPQTAVILAPTRRELPDGSVVLLKEGAQIAQSFSGASRRVELKHGEAIFEVAKDPLRPFVVSAGVVEVRAVGTAFAVEIADRAVEVLVTEGTVLVGAGERASDSSESGRDGSELASSTNPASSSATATVAAGHRALVDTAASVTSPVVTPVTDTERDARLAWRNRRVEFSGTPLEEAVALLNREAADSSRMKLDIRGSELMAMRVSGIFRTDNMDAFVLLLEAGFGVRVERSGRVITLRKESALPN